MIEQESRNGPVTNEALIQGELGRVLSSHTFRRANRMRELLGYVVKRTLAGVDLDEGKTARDVFGKGDDFDASIDPEVRIQYGRLRRKLAVYYASEGRAAPVIINLPARKYQPVFLTNNSGEEDISSTDIANGLPQQFPQSIVVLPFANLTNKGSHDVFCYGLTEELITSLASNPNLNVVASCSAFQFKDKAVDVRTVGEELGARMILEGSVRMEDDRVRVTVRLARVNDGIAMWSGSFDAKVAGELATQQSVADEIVESLDVELSIVAERKNIQ